MLKRFRRGAPGGNFIFPDHGAALTPWSSRSIRVWQGALVFLKPNPIAHVDMATVEALRNRWRGLRRSPIGFHLELGRRAIGFTNGLLCGFTGTRGANLRPYNPAAVNDFSRFRAHGGHYSGLGAARQCH
jgi:hypothetical protein